MSSRVGNSNSIVKALSGDPNLWVPAPELELLLDTVLRGFYPCYQRPRSDAREREGEPSWFGDEERRYLALR
jgi:hypothetical protein